MQTIYLLLGIIGFIAVIAGFFFGGFVTMDFLFMRSRKQKKQIFTLLVIAVVVGIMALPIQQPLVKGLVLALFLIGAPVWFRIEFWMYEAKDGPFAKFAHNQQLMRDIWTGIAAALTIYFFEVVKSP